MCFCSDEQLKWIKGKIKDFLIDMSPHVQNALLNFLALSSWNVCVYDIENNLIGHVFYNITLEQFCYTILIHLYEMCLF